MKILDIWDWKYKLLLSESTFNKTSDFIKDLKSEEKKIYKAITDFYCEFYSFDVLLDLLMKEETESNKILALASKNIDKALRVPPILKGYYIKKINSAFKNDGYLKKQLTQMLLSIIDEKNTFSSTDEIQSIIYGHYYPDIKRTIIQKGIVTEKTDNLIQTQNIELYTKKFLSEIENDHKIVSDFGRCIIPDYEIQIAKGKGFAEWWDRDLIDGEKDLLVLYDNKDAMNLDDFEYTIYHEVYPGHGQFYNYARQTSNTIPKFDHGAMSLIEGWATYCEWNVRNTYYSSSLRERGKMFLDISLLEPDSSEEKITKIYNSKIKRGYTHDQAINSVLYFSQYPGFIESYYLGAICIENMINNKVFCKPADLLEYLKDKTWGELFALWE